MNVAMASKIEVLPLYGDGFFEIALVPTSVAVLDDELVPGCKEDILGGITSENIIVIVLERPGERRPKGTVGPFVATLKDLV